MIIMLCEGGFSLMETDEENFDILKSCKKALKPGGTFIFTMLCAFFPLFNDIEKLYLSESSEGCYHEKVDFDMVELREKSILVITDDLGVKKTIHCNERFLFQLRYGFGSLLLVLKISLFLVQGLESLVKTILSQSRILRC